MKLMRKTNRKKRVKPKTRAGSTRQSGQNMLEKSFLKNMSYRIAGHESFPCRYTWLPKAVQGLTRDPKLFSDDERAMVDLGVGKNMVRAIRFWSQVAGMATMGTKGGGHSLTKLGSVLLGERG